LNTDIQQYYNTLAREYDQDRFGNSYGQFIHAQETRIVSRYLQQVPPEKILDIACGTGRFLPFAQHGIDISPEMVAVAREKYPTKNIQTGDARALPFSQDSFEGIMAFHLFMHLSQPDLEQVLQQTHRVLESGGLFVFDVPSQKRRQLTRYQSKSWHGGFQLDRATLETLTKGAWKIVAVHGIAFLPLHRIPASWRKYFRYLDTWLCHSFFREYSSHLIFILKKI
jgi:ubiquinone/menaquinone biosynthesis C-methylase UbiE